MDAEHSAGVARGYELDGQIREAGAQANQARWNWSASRRGRRSNTDRIAELDARHGDRRTTIWRRRAEQLRDAVGSSCEQQRSFLENATAEANASREEAQAQQAQAQEAARDVACGRSARPRISAARRCSRCSVQRRRTTRSRRLRRRWQGWSARRSGLLSESETARGELETLGAQRGQVAMNVRERDGAAEAAGGGDCRGAADARAEARRRRRSRAGAATSCAPRWRR